MDEEEFNKYVHMARVFMTYPPSGRSLGTTLLVPSMAVQVYTHRHTVTHTYTLTQCTHTLVL